MTCQHDSTYRIENEANGGIGCPLCNRKRNSIPEGWFVNPAVTLEEMAANLSAADIREMEQRTKETDRADDYASHTEGHW